MTPPPLQPGNKRFCELRKHLDQLGYEQHLGRDSLPLAERLFRDLVRTTEALGAERDARAAEQERCEALRGEAAALRSQLARLRREGLADAEETGRRAERERRAEAQRQVEERHGAAERRRECERLEEEVEEEVKTHRAASERRHQGMLEGPGGADVAGSIADLLERTCRRIRDLQGELQGLKEELRWSETRAADLETQVRLLTGGGEEAMVRQSALREHADKLSAQVETLKGELLESEEQRENLQLRMQDFVTEISHVEGMLAMREEEHSHMLARYSEAVHPICEQPLL